MNITPEFIMAAVALIGTFGTLYRVFRLTRHEEASSDAAAAKDYADTSKAFSESAKLSADRAAEAEAEVKKERAERKILEAKVGTLETDVVILKTELRRRDGYIAYLLNGIAILHKQINNTTAEAPCWQPESMDKIAP